MNNEVKNLEYKLTEYSHGAGCGCKISPKVLDEILKTEGVKTTLSLPSMPSAIFMRWVELH